MCFLSTVSTNHGLFTLANGKTPSDSGIVDFSESRLRGGIMNSTKP